MTDMTQNRIPYGLLTDEEKAVLHEHVKAGGELEVWLSTRGWLPTFNWYVSGFTYRTVPIPLTQDEIAWDRLPDWVEWVEGDSSGAIYCQTHEQWFTCTKRRRIDDFPGIVIKRGTCDWKDSKQRRPR